MSKAVTGQTGKVVKNLTLVLTASRVRMM